MSEVKPRSAWDRWADARVLRWALVGLLALGAVVVSFAGGALEVCEEQVVQGSGDVVDVCRGPSVGDPGVLAFLLLLLVGLWPDVSQVSIGVVSLTRKVEEQSARTEEVRRDIKLLALEFNQKISQQVSQQVVQYIGTTAGPEPRKIAAGPAPALGAGLEELLGELRSQSAYRDARIPEAWQLLEEVGLRDVRVAVVGAAIDPALRDIAALRPHIEPTFAVTGASNEAVGATGSGSVGHVLAIAPTATVLPVSVLDASYQIASPTALKEGISGALGWQAEVLLIGLASPRIPEVETLLIERAGTVEMIAPSGNDSASSSAWPGIISAVASVAALEAGGERAPFSNYGTGVDLAAPGVGIISLVGVTRAGLLELGETAGTSSSADIAAGVAALLLATGRVDSGQVLGVLRAGSTRSTGEGLAVLDAAAAVRALPAGPESTSSVD